MKRTINAYGSSIGIALIAVVAGLFLSAVPASAAGYARLGDIKGESLTDGGQRPIDQYNELAPQINEHLDQLLVLAEELRAENFGIISDKATPKLLERAASAADGDEQSADRSDEDSTAAAEYEQASVKLQEAVAQLKDELARAGELIQQIKETNEPQAGATGQSRRRGSAVVEDLTLFAQANQQAAAIEEAVTIVGDIGTEFTASLQ